MLVQAVPQAPPGKKVAYTASLANVGRGLATFSASLPPIYDIPGRSWNGRELTVLEKLGARHAFAAEYHRTRTMWYAAQAAFEWLSEYAW